jgi:signal transduction histidine kinase/CheY-like chemotaxis protein
MSVQAKILLLLLVIVSTLIGGLLALKLWETRKFKAIAVAREIERNRNFDDFLHDRGDKLHILVDDSSVWSDMVRAVVKDDTDWAANHISEETLATYAVNAVWIYKLDQTLFYSRNNRYAQNLREMPLPNEAFGKLFATQRACHFFLRVPQGWMEIRGATIHPSIDRLRESKPEGYFFAGQIWIDDQLRRVSAFTGYDLRIDPIEDVAPDSPETEDHGRITFSRLLPGWSGEPVARMVVENDSPIIHEFNRAGRLLFLGLILFAVGLYVVLALCLNLWVRRPLRRLAQGLESNEEAVLQPLLGTRNEFGRLADLILKFRRTQEALLDTEDRLRHAQKLEAIGRLAGGVAHDFNNLLTAIIGYSELLEARLEGGDEARDFARHIRETGEKAAALTRQLLAFSRRQLLLPRVLDLNALIRDLEKLLQRVIGEHIRIVIDARALDARVRADPGQLEQVILNLGVNARDAMPRGGTLTIATENRDALKAGLEHDAPVPAAGYVFLIITDTGCGMDAGTRERIFEPFFTTKGPGKGTGLGLATVYGIVKQSGGGIDVDSESGKGSTFLIFLPRETAPADVVADPVAPALPAPNAETILVVEDEEVVRQLVCTVLGDVGYRVLCAGSPSEALSLVRQHPDGIELLVTDVVMPEMHGPALARQVLGLRPDTRVLYISGYSENEISDQGVIDPALEVLQKPFTKAVLIRKVREMLDGAVRPS